MKAQVEPMQQPVRKVAGRSPTISKRLAQLEDLIRFLKEYSPEALANREGDFYPVKKAVGHLRR